MKKRKKDNAIILTVIVVVLLLIFCVIYNLKYRSVNGGWGWMHMYGANYGLFGSGNDNGGWDRNTMMNNRLSDDSDITPKSSEPVFDETKPVSLTGTTSLIIAEKIEPNLAAVFGQVKVTAFSGEYLGQANSFLVTYKTPRVITSDDAGKLVKEFTKSGYSVGIKSVTDTSTSILFDNKKVTITVSFLNSGSQEIGVLYMEKVYE